jgi:hypothetical protein
MEHKRNKDIIKKTTKGKPIVDKKLRSSTTWFQYINKIKIGFEKVKHRAPKSADI